MLYLKIYIIGVITMFILVIVSRMFFIHSTEYSKNNNLSKADIFVIVFSCFTWFMFVLEIIGDTCSHFSEFIEDTIRSIFDKN